MDSDHSSTSRIPEIVIKEPVVVQSDFSDLQEKLFSHKIYKILKTENDIKIFMKHHVFAVYDFMTILKCIKDNHLRQQEKKQNRIIWTPVKQHNLARFINQMMIDEETGLDKIIFVFF